MTDTAVERSTFGRLFQRGTTYYLRFRQNGSEVTESLRTSDLRVAEKKRAMKEAECGLGVLVKPDAKRVTFADLARIIRENYRVKGNRTLAVTIDADGTEHYSGALEDALKMLAGYFGESTRALAITTDRVTAFECAMLAEGYARATVNKALAALRRAFNLAIRAGRLTTKPAISTPDPKNARQGFFEDEDFRAVLAELPEALRPVMEFCYLTGWRPINEVLPLTWDRVDFDAGMLRLEPNTTKNNEGRMFPFDTYPPLAALLKRQRAHRIETERRVGRIIPHVFHRAGEPIRSYDHAWRSAVERAAITQVDGRDVVVRPGLLGRLVYDFRRTAVRNLEAAGVPRSVGMKLTGHKTEAVYRRYAIVAAQDLREGVAKLAGMHGRVARRQSGRGTTGVQRAILAIGAR